MKLLSIDVGIKNLAYCLIEKKEKLTIIDWNIINLSNETTYQCKYCSKKANYINNNIYCCKVHAKKAGFLKEDIKSIHNLNKQQIITLFSKKNVPCNTIHTKKKLVHLLKQNIFTKIKKTNCNKINLIDIGKQIALQFDKLFNHQAIDFVLIENQISKIANRMKCIQGMIAQYFIMKHIYAIEFISSINKLKCIPTKQATYSDRKKSSIEFTIQYITKHQPDILTHFNTHNKQDDLADSFLQGLYYLNK